MKLGRVVKNTAWMGLVQVANMALPLLTVPLISRSFGPALYGEVASLTAMASYAGLLVTFGFHLSGPRAVVRAAGDPARLSLEFASIYLAQLGLAASASLAFLLAMPALGYQGEQWRLGAVILCGVVASALTPIWMFLGLQMMRQVAVSQLATRLMGAALIIASVRTPKDVLLFACINAAASVVCLAWSLIALRRLGYPLRSVDWRGPGRAIRTASNIFMSSIAINLYTASNVVVVSFLAGPAAAGYFALADRIRGAAVGVLDPVSQALYPYLCDTGHDAAAEALRATNRRLFFQLILALSICAGLCLYFVAPVLASVLGGQKFMEAVPIIKVLAATPFLICLNNLLGLQVMLPMDMETELSRVVMGAAALGLPLVFIATWQAGAVGTAAAYVAVELGITVTEVWIISRRQSVVALFVAKNSLRPRQA